MEDIARWLANDAPHNGVKELFAAFCQQIVRSGMPVGRAPLGLEVLHPEVSGWQQAEAQACLTLERVQTDIGELEPGGIVGIHFADNLLYRFDPAAGFIAPVAHDDG
jgi:hypothetical protein